MASLMFEIQMDIFDVFFWKSTAVFSISSLTSSVWWQQIIVKNEQILSVLL